jgi:hypothetical protein
VISLLQISPTKALYAILLSFLRAIRAAHPCCDCPNNIFSMILFLKSSPIFNSSLRLYCCTIAVLLLYYCSTIAVLLLYYCCISVLLLYHCGLQQ